MSVDTTLAVLYAQSGLSTNVANAAMVAPQASLAMSRMLAAEAARLERQQVEKSEDTEKANIHKDDQRKKGFFGSRLRARRKQELETEETPLATTALLGNLLNVKV